jgi:hypothetical protein
VSLIAVQVPVTYTTRQWSTRDREVEITYWRNGTCCSGTQEEEFPETKVAFLQPTSWTKTVSTMKTGLGRKKCAKTSLTVIFLLLGT